MIKITIFIDGNNVGDIKTKFARNALNFMNCLSDVFGATFSVYEIDEDEDFVNVENEE